MQAGPGVASGEPTQGDANADAVRQMTNATLARWRALV